MRTSQRSNTAGCASWICINNVEMRSLLNPPPQPSTRARSFPVPRGRTPTGGLCSTSVSSSSACRIHATVPSPPHTNTRSLGRWQKRRSATRGSVTCRSTTCSGLRFWRSSEVSMPPSCPPLWLLTKTSSGMASSGSRFGSMEVIGLNLPLRVVRLILRITFRVTRVRELRVGASVTHSGGRMSRACLDCCRVQYHPSCARLCAAYLVRNHRVERARPRRVTTIWYHTAAPRGTYSDSGRSSTSAVMLSTHPLRFTPCTCSVSAVRFSNHVSPPLAATRSSPMVSPRRGARRKERGPPP
mmetsp:Transcript_3936/g.9530  ORF Transcript_3936/g.9530 Transcript_3936/m.9530 type:complete len:299 (+) Transcript_3936:92-988(+)